VTTPAAATGAGEWTERLRRDGYVVVPAGAAPKLCHRASTDIDRFKARNRRAVTANADPAGHLVRVVTLHEVIESLQPLFAANAALAVCDEFFGAETALYTSLFFERGSEQKLHRDSRAFTTRPEGRYLGMWVALEDTDTDNGPLVVVPGSHAIDPIDVTAIAEDLYGDPAPHPGTTRPGGTPTSGRSRPAVRRPACTRARSTWPPATPSSGTRSCSTVAPPTATARAVGGRWSST